MLINILICLSKISKPILAYCFTVSLLVVQLHYNANIAMSSAMPKQLIFIPSVP